MTLVIRPFQQTDEDATVALWQAAQITRPWNDPRADIERKRAVQQELFLVAVLEGELVGTAMAGYDGHRGWVYYVAVSPTHRRQGLGRALMSAVEQRLCEQGCVKLNLQVRADNRAALEFYTRLGYLEEPRISLGKRLGGSSSTGSA